MPKMRGIKTETWTDSKFVSVSPLARLLFIGMWNYACDNGHIDNDPLQLKMRILPIDSCDISELVSELSESGLVVVTDDYLKVPNLPVHQRIDERYLTTCDHCETDVDSRFTRRAHVGDTSGTRRAHAGDTSGTRGDTRAPTLKEGRKEGEGEGERKGAPRARAARLPQDWRPTPELTAYARDKRPDLDLDDTIENFRDYWLSKSGKDATKLDWSRTFKTWVRNEKPGRRREDQPAKSWADSLPSVHELRFQDE